MCFCSTFSNSYEKWVTYILANILWLCVFLQSWTYEGNFLSAPCHESKMTLLNDPKDFSYSLSEFSPSSATDYDGVIGSSSSYFSVPYFCSTNASSFTLYLKIGNSYLLSCGSFAFSSHFFFYVPSNEYCFGLFVPNRYFAWHNK